jgi:hypothetical protein
MISFQQAREAVAREFDIDTSSKGLQDSYDYVVFNNELVIDDVQYWVSKDTGRPRIELGYEVAERRPTMRPASVSA